MLQDVSGWIAINPPGRHAGVAVADVLVDGRPAFVVAGAGGPNRVLRWAGGRLVDSAPPLLADPASHATGVAASDLDGDGVEELVVTAAGGPDRLFKRHPDGTWEDLLARAGRTGGGRSVAALDRRGVGRYAFAVSGPGPLRLIELTADGRLLDLAPALDLHAAGGWGVLAAPLLGPGPDLLVANEEGPTVFLRNRGDGTFEDVAGWLGPDEPSRAAAAVDVGGVLGLCLAGADAPHRLLVPGPGGWQDRATPGLALPSAARAVVAADLDNDGHDELFVVNHGEPNRLFRVRGDAPDIEVVMLDPGDAAGPDDPGVGAAVCDIDGDGVLELLVTHAGRPLSLYKAGSAAGNGWLRVVPLTRFGAPARGAAVRLSAGGRTRVKVVDGGPGEPVAHFGLGSDTRPERLTVTWPDGVEVEFAAPGANRTLTVRYPGG
ncbi:MAG: CRTAC1 family protein [Gemmataceae bacterium]|nr:CRTAC1 family protein [Gemmataceae bacterium]